jgi:beta-lactamase regulating signal transducer with metallopeptidase domain
MNRLLEIGLSNAAIATLLAVGAIVIARVARRPAWSHCLWLLVMIRLISPPLLGVQLPWSFDWSSRATPRVAEVTGEVRDGGAARATVESKPIVQTAELRRERSLELISAPSLAPTPIQQTIAGVPATGAEASGPIVAPASWDPQFWAVRIFAVWLAGSVVWFGVVAVRILRFHRLLQHAKPAPEWLQEQAQELSDRLGIGRCPAVCVVPFAVSPMLWGMIGPVRLVLPSELLTQLAKDEQVSLLAHELAHYRRHDHWVRWLEIVALGFYWWHPVAWWARREIGRAEEQCCDAWVVCSLPGTAVSYAKALLKTVDFLSEARLALPPAASGAGHVHTLRRRVTMILRKPSEHRLTWPARLGAVALGLLVLPFGPRVLNAKLLDERVIAESAQDPDDEGSDRSSRQLDRRLRRVEEKLDRLSSELSAPRAKKKAERARGKSEADTPKRPEAGRDTPKPRASETKKAPREAAEAEEALEALGEKLSAQIEEAVEKAIDPERLEAMGRQIEEAVQKGIDPERIEAMAKRLEEAFKDGRIDTEQLSKMGQEIGEAVKKGIDPEKLAEMGKAIGEAVKKGIDTESLKKMGDELQEAFKSGKLSEELKNGFEGKDASDLAKRIEETVKKTIDPKRMEQMAKEIEEAVKKGIDPKRMEEMSKEIERSVENSLGELKPKGGEAKPPEGKKAKPSPSKAKEARDIEQKIRQLEEKLEKLLKSLPDDDDDDKQ